MSTSMYGIVLMSALVVLLSAVQLRGQFKILTMNDGHVVVDWEGSQPTRITFGDSATAVRILVKDRYLIATRRRQAMSLVNGKGNVLSALFFTDVRQLWPMTRLFSTRTEGNNGSEDLYEIRDQDGKKFIDRVFHQVEVDYPFQSRIVCRHGNIAYILDTTGNIRETRTLYRIGEPSQEFGFWGRWKWKKYRSYDYASNFIYKGDSIVRIEPPWPVDHRDGSSESPIEGRLSMSIDHSSPLLFANVIRGTTVTIRNVSPDPIRLSAFAGLVPIVFEVLAKDGKWIRLSRDRNGYCGNSGGYKDLLPSGSFVIVIPVFTGSTPTRFRCRMTYCDRIGRTAEIVSDEWEGSINFGASEWSWQYGVYGDLVQTVD
ncbi:MAG TPA: hypothetical protein VK147_10460 [Candidatus Didemnitutus sp.]|nr:hypothetical protein [Candidatus Didemnitutus sp.]